MGGSVKGCHTVPVKRDFRCNVIRGILVGRRSMIKVVGVTELPMYMYTCNYIVCAYMSENLHAYPDLSDVIPMRRTPHKTSEINKV